MARNEEKQLARLNRYYLEIQKQEELKKRPPRPRLDTLNTPRELRKWLPTITRDIEFYVKQMEVTCYSDSKIEEIQDRIQRLKNEYRAYLHKLRALEPDLNAASWADRPYTNRKRPANSDSAQENNADGEAPQTKSPSTSSGTLAQFVPIPTPVLQHLPALASQYSWDRPAPPPVIWNANPDTEDKPLQFASSTTPTICHHHHHVTEGTSSSSKDSAIDLSSALSVPSCANSGRLDCVTVHDNPSISGTCQASCEADLGKETVTVCSTESVIFSRVDSNSHKKPAVISTSGTLTCSENKVVNILTPVEIANHDKVGNTTCEETVSDVVLKHDQSAKFSFKSVQSKVQSEHVASVNPLNLDYSDSSDDDT